MLTRTFLIMGLLLMMVRTAQAQSVTARGAAERSLPFLEREGVAWMNQKGCASCHNVPFLLWSHNAARTHGISVDEKKVAEWRDWTWKFSRSKREWFKLNKASLSGADEVALPLSKLDSIIDKGFTTEQEFTAALGRLLSQTELDHYKAALIKLATRPCEPTNDGGGLDTLSQLVLGRASPGPDAELTSLMLRWQQPDGSWKAAGQLPLQNRPAAETNTVTTLWAVLALSTLDGPDAATKQAIARALDSVRATEPGQSTESLIVRMLVEHKLGHAERSQRLFKQLVSEQNHDGGWGWRRSGASDAFATGQALYALSQCDVRSNEKTIESGRKYLIESQSADGSWSVPPRAISNATNEGRLKRLEPIYRYWGTGWAAIGLSETLRKTNAD